jgi:hypothetical protein
MHKVLILVIVEKLQKLIMNHDIINLILMT